MAESPVRVLTAVPLCDGHDSAITAINLELIRNGIEVVYLGFHRSVADIVRAAVQEDVAAVGISSYNGGHIEFFREVSLGLREMGRPEIGLFGGGGGTITPADATRMHDEGTDRIFLPGSTFDEMTAYIRGFTRIMEAPPADAASAEPLVLALQDGGRGDLLKQLDLAFVYLIAIRNDPALLAVNLRRYARACRVLGRSPEREVRALLVAALRHTSQALERRLLGLPPGVHTRNGEACTAVRGLSDIGQAIDAIHRGLSDRGVRPPWAA